MQNFGIWATFRHLFEIKTATFFYGPSIVHKDDHFAKKKTASKLDER